jgi:predicted cytidylate kinase
MRIVLSGNAGSGKTTVGKLLAERLNIEFLSVGQICREKALAQGMDINQFQEYLRSDEEFDKAMDGYIAEYTQSRSSYILDYRLGFYFLPESYKVLLKVSDDVAFGRISNRNGRDENLVTGSSAEMMLLLKTRNELMRQRFIKVYQVDFLDEGRYDLVLDTSIVSPERILEEIVANQIR